MSSISAGTTSTTALVSTADTAGSLVLKTGASATTALTLDTSQNATFAGTVTTVTGTVYPLVSGTAQASTSGTSIDFTGIPSTAKRITVMFNGVSTNGTSNWLVRVGNGSIISSGYSSSSSYFVAGGVSTQADTSGFLIRSDNAANVISGAMVIYNFSGNTWVETWIGGNGPNTQTHLGGGTIALAGTLDRVRITTVNGTDTFDAGTINILWE